MNATNNSNTFRAKNGQYGMSNMELLCTCGHKLGVHLAAGDRGCIVGDFEECDCKCTKFKKVKAAK